VKIKSLLSAVLIAAASCAPAKAASVGDFFSALFFPHKGGDHATAPRKRAPLRLAARQPLVGHAMLASFYGGGPLKYEPNSHTANGERFNQWGLTAAHRTLPFGTRLQVCFSGCAVVRINDRGPAKWTGRSLDLSRGAASAVGLVRRGVGTVRVAILGR
jgi:rare lipoprotein A